MLNDMMSHFELFQPADVDNAFELLDRFGEDCWTIAGGHDSLAWFKDRGKQPSAVIDLAGIAELHGIRETAGGLELGAMTTLTEVERHPVIQERFGLLAEAARMVASPQIRNSGTMGGNVVQDTRCWYYRFGLACYRAGGNTCYASAPEAMNREHAIFWRQPMCCRFSLRSRARSYGARSGDGDSQLQWRAGGFRGGLLHDAGRRHPAHDGPRA